MFIAGHPLPPLNDPTLANAKGFVSGNTIFTLVVTDAKGCRDTDRVIIRMNPNPIVNAGADTGVCTGQIVQLNASASPGATFFFWKPSTNISNIQVLKPFVKVQGDITYTLIAKDAAGCADTASVNIKALPRPTAYAGESMSLCFPDSVELKGSGAGIFAWFPTDDMTGWNTSSPKVFVGKDKPKVISLAVTNGYGCADTTTISLAVSPDPVYNVTPDSAEGCPGSFITLSASGGNYYKWTPSQGLSTDSSASTFATITGDMIYNVRIADICGRDSTLSVHLKAKPSPDIQLTKSGDIDCKNDIIQLSASGAATYLWSPGAWLSDPSSANTSAEPKEPIWYIVTGTTQDGCVGRDSIYIDVVNKKQFFAANAFTPDGDGRNDCYSIIAPNDVTHFEFSIFNRWGNNVFSSTSVNSCWNGTYNGTPQPAGTYYYFYKATTPKCGTITDKGSIHLLK